MRGVLVGPVGGENLVGLAAEQEVEFLLEQAVDFFAANLVEVGHRPAAELEAMSRILRRPAGRLHDAIQGNLGADDNLSHGHSPLKLQTASVRSKLRMKVYQWRKRAPTLVIEALPLRRNRQGFV